MAGGGDPRESATESKPPRFIGVRVKGWGKSPPRDWQQERHGKPHREQDRIGTVRGETFEGCFRPTVRVGCVRRMATCAQDEWPPRSRSERARAVQNPAYRPAGNSPRYGRSIEISRLRPRARLLIQSARQLIQLLGSFGSNGILEDGAIKSYHNRIDGSGACHGSGRQT